MADKSIISQMTQLSTVIIFFAAIERVFEILDEEEKYLMLKNPVKIENVKEMLHLEHVNFGYGENSTLIEDLNAKVKVVRW